MSSERPVSVATKIVTIDERRNVMRNLPDPKHFPGKGGSFRPVPRLFPPTHPLTHPLAQQQR